MRPATERSTSAGILSRAGSALPWSSKAHLPTHVKRQIDRRRRDSELLISTVQTALIVLFAILYFAARKTAPPMSMLHPVPWALGVYAGFTMLRLWLAVRNRISPVIQAMSIVIDVAVLMITIWSFHLQYQQPAAFYLKAPTLLYVFIFIALRTLSFSPGYVLGTGVVAALGWLALLGFAILEPGGMDLITHDYVAYMNSARILLGAEIDKVISILVVTGLLTVAVAGARGLLQQAIAEQAAASQLTRFLAPEVASAIVEADETLSLGEGHQLTAAVMFIDLRGFTELAAALKPSDLMRLLGEYQRMAVPVIHRHHGTVITFLGDGIMVTFGAPRPSSTFAADALRAADDLLDAFDRWHDARDAAGHTAPGIGIGLAHGTVTCGAVGDEARMEYAVIGDPVNRAAKLQNQTKSEAARALTVVEMLELAIEQGYADGRVRERRPMRSVAGIAHPLDLVVLAGKS